MSWGQGIVVAFTGFALFIGTLVTICVKQEMSLVSKDYYQQELDYQNQIDRIENTATLQIRPAMVVAGDTLKLLFSSLPNVEHGLIKVTRASSARHDASFELPRNVTVDELDFHLPDLPRGRYKASFAWTMDGKEYYIDQPIDH